MPIINSILDNDMYKFTMQQIVAEKFPNTEVSYKFIDRRKDGKFNEFFLSFFNKELDSFADLVLKQEEQQYMSRMYYLKKSYIDFLSKFRFNPNNVTAKVVDGQLELDINGLWKDTILWEVPLMALISELYFKVCDKSWDMTGQSEKAKNKINTLKNVEFMEFGTRRRRSFETQEIIIQTIKEQIEHPKTSNVYFAMKYGMIPIGTVAHELTMGMSAYSGIKEANYNTCKLWADFYEPDLMVALTDTFGTDLFYENMNYDLTRRYKGFRQDSGDPREWLLKTIQHMKKHKITETKAVLYTDSLDCEKCIYLDTFTKEKENGQFNPRFGIGTHLTNDFEGSKALNIVIKLSKCNDIDVVKISDEPTKASGNPVAVNKALKLIGKQK